MCGACTSDELTEILVGVFQLLGVAEERRRVTSEHWRSALGTIFPEGGEIAVRSDEIFALVVGNTKTCECGHS